MPKELTDALTPEELEESRLRARVMVLLQNYRKKHGYTQRELAELFGVTQGLVSRWENCEENFKISTLVKIAIVTGTHIEIDFSEKP
jgi:transcriptional regulator with XRE-family HTH domain